MPLQKLQARCALALSLLFATHGMAAGDAVDDYVQSFFAKQHVPGAAIAVIRDGKVVKEVLSGSANLQLGVPIARTTVFQLASVTKIFTAVALMRLEQDGKLRLDDPVSKYLSDLPAAWSTVTLREMATHTSGLPDVIADPNQPLSKAELARTDEEALRFAATREITAPAGSRFQYDQTNYVLLKRVIEKVSGESFRASVTSRVLGTAMPRTSWGDARAIIPGRADMYTELNHDRVENGANLYQYPDYLDAAAGLNSNLVDMEMFGTRLTGGELLNPTELAEMWKPAKTRAGVLVDISKDMEITGEVAPAAGWFYADNSKGEYPRVFMTGGSAVSVVAFPKQRLCIVVLTNLQAKDDPLPIAEGVAKFYLPDLKPMF